MVKLVATAVLLILGAPLVSFAAAEAERISDFSDSTDSTVLIAKNNKKEKPSKVNSKQKPADDNASNAKGSDNDDVGPSSTSKVSSPAKAKSPSNSAKANSPDSKSDIADDNDAGKSAKPSFSGNASWYGIPFHGRKTASGEIFNMYKNSAAHLTLPLPSKALVEDPRTGNVVLVKVNDRGPYCKTRVMDLSREAARKLGTLPRGVAFVDITVIDAKKKTKS